MLNFIKKFFEKKPVKRQVKLEDLEEWLQSETKEKIEAVKAEIKLIFNKIEEEKDKLKKNIEVLERAELQNPHISVKEKQFMEGNRFSYIRKLNSFLEEMSFEEKKRVADFCQSFEASLDKLDKSTAKSYYVVREFFSQYASNIAQNIKNIDNFVRAAKELLEKRELKLIEEAKNKIADLNGKIQLKKRIIGAIEAKEAQLNSVEKERQEMEKKIAETKSSKDFLEIRRLEQDYRGIIESINKTREPFLNDFYVIEAAMKKYERISLEEKTVSSYLANPVAALRKDRELKIVEILKNLKENILKDAIELKDKKRERILAKVEELDGAYLKNFLEKYEELLNAKSDIEKVIESKTVKRILNELNSKLTDLNNKIEKIEIEIDNLKRDKEKADLDEAKKKIQLDLMEITGLDVEIV